MPSTSKKQHDAMEAAAHGKSTLGIPKSVGQEFAQADKGKKFSTKAVSGALRKRKGSANPTGDASGGSVPGGAGM